MEGYSHATALIAVASNEDTRCLLSHCVPTEEIHLLTSPRPHANMMRTGDGEDVDMALQSTVYKGFLEQGD